MKKDAQLLQPPGMNLRDQLGTLANDVLSGGTNTATGAPEKGVSSISSQIQQLATMDVMIYQQTK